MSKPILRRALLLFLAFVAASPVFLFIVLRLLGLAGIYSIPTAGMAPAVKKGDRIFTEGVTYRFRKPQRGEIVSFISDHVAPETPGEIYLKRIIGLPGETLRVEGGKLYVNGNPVSISSRDGEIVFKQPEHPFGHLVEGNDEIVPASSYFVIGDNLDHSDDSRDWGAVPAGDIRGRAIFCWWPPADIGSIK